VLLPLAFILAVTLALTIYTPSASGEQGNPSALQLIALEGARQAMLEAQLSEIVTRVDDLLADIGTNEHVNEAVTASTSEIRSRLEAIGQMRLAPARELLNQATKDQQKAAAARQVTELAARDLASLLLQAGISQASEVFAMELGEIITAQEKLQDNASSTRDGSASQAAVKRQRDLAERVAALTGELAAVDQTTGNPLAAVRLARARKIVEEGKVVESMRQACAFWTRAPLGVAAWHAQALRQLRQSLLKLRPDASLEELVRARNVVQEIMDSQRALRTRIAALTSANFEGQKEGLQLQQERMLIPLQEFGETIGVGMPMQVARQAGRRAAESFQGGDSDAVLAAQVRIEDAMVLARVQISNQIDRMNSLSRTRRKMLNAAARMKSLTELRDRAEWIRNSAYEMATAGDGLAGVATAQQQLAQDIARFQSQLPEDDHFASAIAQPIGKAAQICEAAVKPLRDSSIDEVMPHWLKLEGILDETLDIATGELSVREKLWTFSQASADIRQLGASLEDIRSELAGVRTKIESAHRDGRTVLDVTDQQSILTQAAQQVQETVGIIGEALPMNEPVGLAIASMTEAVENLRQDRPEAALESVDQAIAGLNVGHETKTRLVEQLELIPMELNSALELNGRAMDILQRQMDLRETTVEASEEELKRLTDEQGAVHAETKTMISLTVAPEAVGAFRLACDEMGAAIGDLRIPARDLAVEHQRIAELALREGIQILDKLISALILAAENRDDDVKVAAFLDGIQSLILLTAAQKEHLELTQQTPDSLLPLYVQKELEFSDRAKEISLGPNMLTLEGRIAGWEHIEAAAQGMEQAAATLEARAKEPTITHQRAADKELRVAIAMNVYELAMSLEPPELFEALDLPDLDPKGHWFNFIKGSPAGKIVTGKKGEWNSLVERERSALHENFARELPLEYRQLLKDYYRSLAK
jgi:hypothetical protein